MEFENTKSSLRRDPPNSPGPPRITISGPYWAQRVDGLVPGARTNYQGLSLRLTRNGVAGPSNVTRKKVPEKTRPKGKGYLTNQTVMLELKKNDPN